MTGSARSSAALPDLFVATTFGQVGNAAAIAAATGRGGVLLLLTAEGNRALAARILARAAATGLDHREVIAPRNAGQPLRRVIRAYDAQLDAALAGLAFQRLWLSNGDMVFNALAERADRLGAAVCFYEDGLSSYRAADDPSFLPLGLRAQASLSARALAQQIGRIRRAARGVQGGSAGLGAEVADLMRKTRVHAELCALASPLRAALARGPYFGRRRRFDEAWVAFPEALDRDVVAARAYRTLRPAPRAEDVATARAAVAALAAGDAPPALYVSQTYGNTLDFYNAVAAVLAPLAGAAIALKHHPREKGLRREALAKALTARGVRAVSSPALDAPPAEALFATGAFRDVYGLTSTALLLGRAASPGVAFHPLGAEVAAALRAGPGPLWRYERFMGDVALFARLWRGEGGAA